MKLKYKIIKLLLKWMGVVMNIDNQPQIEYKCAEVNLPDTWLAKQPSGYTFIAFESGNELYLRPENNKEGYLLSVDLLYTLIKHIHSFTIDYNKISRISFGYIKTMLDYAFKYIESEKSNEEQ